MRYPESRIHETRQCEAPVRDIRYQYFVATAYRDQGGVDGLDGGGYRDLASGTATGSLSPHSALRPGCFLFTLYIHTVFQVSPRTALRRGAHGRRRSAGAAHTADALSTVHVRAPRRTAKAHRPHPHPQRSVAQATGRKYSWSCGFRCPWPAMVQLYSALSRGAIRILYAWAQPASHTALTRRVPLTSTLQSAVTCSRIPTDR